MSSPIDNVIFKETALSIDDLISLMECVGPLVPETAVPITIPTRSKSKTNSYSTSILTGAFLLFLGTQDAGGHPKKINFRTSQETTIEVLYNYNKEVYSLFTLYEKEIELINYAPNKAPFVVDDNLQFIQLATELFKGSQPLGGKEMEYLQECIAENSITEPTLPDRL